MITHAYTCTLTYPYSLINSMYRYPHTHTLSDCCTPSHSHGYLTYDFSLQHYHTVHGSKEYTCQKCGKKFGLRDVCNRHEAECGREFSCETCGEKFRTKNAHYKHAVRKKHVLPVGSRPKSKQKGSRKTDNVVLRPPTVIVKNVVQLPPKRVSTTAQTSLTGLPGNQVKPTPQTHNMAVQVESALRSLIEGTSSASQTNESYLSVHSRHDNAAQTSSEKSVGTTISTLCGVTTSKEDHQLNLELTDFATQTEPRSLTPLHFNLATQTDSLSTATMGIQHNGSTDQAFSFSDLATQTTDKDFGVVLANFSFSELATQTSEEDVGRVSSNLSFDNLASPSGFIQHSGEPSQLGTALNNSSSSQSQAIQTLPLPTNELGTQTLSLCHIFQSEDFPQFHDHPPPDTDLSAISQRCHEHCSSATGSDEYRRHHLHHQCCEFSREEIGSCSAAVEFGTQTTPEFVPLSCSSSSVSDFGTQTTITDKELSDLVCELSSDTLQHILPPECMDFGTQTLESELAGIEYLDFGVQTSFGLELSTRQQDQSSQTQD